MIRRLPDLLLLLTALVMITGCSFSPVNTGLFSSTALKGYDPVAYFTQGKAVPGSPSFATTWQGVTWHFSSPEHQMYFTHNPDKYLPQYGGYCAWAVAHDSLADIDPEAWKIVDGKLYLNYNQEIQQQWEDDQSTLIQDADRNWAVMIEK